MTVPASMWASGVSAARAEEVDTTSRARARGSTGGQKGASGRNGVAGPAGEGGGETCAGAHAERSTATAAVRGPAMRG